MNSLSKSVFLVAILFLSSCNDTIDEVNDNPLDTEVSTISITGSAVIKVLPTTNGWVALKETPKPVENFTAPLREISWMNGNFKETSSYKPAEDWSLIDIAVHPSGEVSAVLIQLDFPIPSDYEWNVKLLRFKTDGSVVESVLGKPVLDLPDLKLYPGTLDRIEILATGEDLYLVGRLKYHVVYAHKLSFKNNGFNLEWREVVEPSAYLTISGIIGGGYDNFRQTERYFFIQADVDTEGNLYVAVPSSEDLLQQHDEYFNENLSSGTDPANYDYGVAILTKLSPQGQRVYSKLEGRLYHTRIINMRVLNDRVYFVGRFKKGKEPNDWDAWILTADTQTGTQIYDKLIDIRQGDMFWNIAPLSNGGTIAVGTSDYTQNPQGLSVSDSRKALAIHLDEQGQFIRELELPQGPAARGSEAIFVNVLPNGKILYAGAHNAPGTHAAVYSDGFIAVRDLIEQP